jgi:hypothetical protein
MPGWGDYLSKRHHVEEVPATSIAPYFPGPLEWEASLGVDDGNVRAR